MRIAFGSDHAGFRLRTDLARYAASLGHEAAEYGADGADAFDYPIAADLVADELLAGRAERGVLVCGTGIGVSIRANRYRFIRAALCTSPEMARLAREHNDANVLCVGERILETDVALRILDEFLTRATSQEPRHLRRVEELDSTLKP